ncbi:DNA gyrase subunit A [Patescibacteria group bacterium]|nr:DNA gyrase subunit A [Patescibacteria group bacterium]MBU1931704.1 DNA gyrase subunit A [Patescibacteria group bacterium]
MNKDTNDNGEVTIKKTAYGLVQTAPIVKEMEKSYLDYAMSVIVSRALPDIRDGLKPVHRRILYAMKEIGLSYTSSYKKSARIVGEVLGKYHPHGDMAVYAALVRMAQTFSLRYPLIDGQGNFGSVDGDSPAAMRYTEAKLAKITDELLFDIDKDTVKFIDNFDGSQQEPTVLPGKLPNLLLMGADGIAVGMATKIPPHNITEIIQAINFLIKKGQVVADEKLPEKIVDPEKIAPQVLAGKFHSEVSIEELMEFIQGPDFPTGAEIWGIEGIRDAYTNGKGKIIVRAKAEIVETKKGGLKIVVTELPYQVNKSRLIIKIADLVKKKKIEGIRNLRDESDRRGLQVVIFLKKDARAKSILNNLYKHTELQTSFPANMVALVDGIPQLLNLKRILVEYVKHRQLVVCRRSQFELIKAKQRLHILEGLKIALDNLDAVIDTIKKSKDAEVAKLNLIKKFALTEIQAQAILDMQLRRLAALERQKIEDEYQLIKEAIVYLEDLLTHPGKILKVIQTELKQLEEKYADARRTKIYKRSLKQIGEIDLVPSEDCLVTITKTGYIKRIPRNTYRSQRRGGKGVSGMATKETDEVNLLLAANTHDDILFFTNQGRVFKVKVYDLPQGSRQAKGQAIINLINIEPGETIQSVLALAHDAHPKHLIMATKKGTVKKTLTAQFINIRSNGLIAIRLEKNDELIWVAPTSGNDQIMMISHQGKAIRFKEANVRSMGRSTKGVRGMRLKTDDFVVSAISFSEAIIKPKDKRKKYFRDILIVTENGLGKRTPIKSFPMQKRGGQGVKVAQISQKTGSIADAKLVTQAVEQIMITSKAAQIIKLPLKNIPTLGRATQGVILMRFAKKDNQVAAITCLKKKIK